MLNKRQQLLLFTAISHKELIFYQGSVNHSLHIITTGGVGSRNYILYRYYRTIRFSFFNYTIAVTVALLYIRMLRRAIISTQFVARRESAMHRVNARAIVSRRSVDANDDWRLTDDKPGRWLGATPWPSPAVTPDTDTLAKRRCLLWMLGLQVVPSRRRRVSARNRTPEITDCCSPALRRNVRALTCINDVCKTRNDRRRIANEWSRRRVAAVCTSNHGLEWDKYDGPSVRRYW